MKYQIFLLAMFLIMFLIIFLNIKKDTFSDVQRYDNDEILHSNYEIQDLKIKDIKKQNGWDTYWDKRSSVSFKDYSIFNGTKFKNYIKNLDLDINL